MLTRWPIIVSAACYTIQTKWLTKIKVPGSRLSCKMRKWTTLYLYFDSRYQKCFKWIQRYSPAGLFSNVWWTSYVTGGFDSLLGARKQQSLNLNQFPTITLDFCETLEARSEYLQIHRQEFFTSAFKRKIYSTDNFIISKANWYMWP